MSTADNRVSAVERGSEWRNQCSLPKVEWEFCVHGHIWMDLKLQLARTMSTA